MAVFQVVVSERRFDDIRDILIKAQAHFQLKDGKKYTQGATVQKIFNEWAKNKGFKNSKDDSKKAMIANDPKELEHIKDLYKKANKGNQQADRDLQNIFERVADEFRFIPM